MKHYNSQRQKFAKAFVVQMRVIGALMIRETSTRFGKENIGFLWIMVEPLLFAVLVGIMWAYMRGKEEHGINIMAFVATGYIPLVFFRHAMTRSLKSLSANSGLLYHRQVKIFDLITARVMIENIGHIMAYIFLGTALWLFNMFPTPSDCFYILLGWIYYFLFTFGICAIMAPLSEFSEILEKFIPVFTYVMVPFSGTFTMQSWLAPKARAIISYSPPVHAMEMMRQGIFGNSVRSEFSLTYPLIVSFAMIAVGMLLCRIARSRLVVE